MKIGTGEIKKVEIENFDSLLSSEFKNLSKTFWSPAEVIQMAIEWLELDASSTVLDIGSGVGKFCILGSTMSDAEFFGVEIRKNLIDEANRLVQELDLNKVQFIHSDIKDIDFSEFNSFFYYNPFCEHLAIDEVIDDSLEFSRENHRRYEDYIFDKLLKLPKGVKIVTYHSPQLALPNMYRMKKTNDQNMLSLWVKQ